MRVTYWGRGEESPEFTGRTHSQWGTQTRLHRPWAGMKGPQECWASLCRQSHLTAVHDLRLLYLPGCHARDVLEVGCCQVESFRGDCLKTSLPDTISFASAGQLPSSSVAKIPSPCFLLIPPVVAKSSSTHTFQTTHQLQHSSVIWN